MLILQFLDALGLDPSGLLAKNSKATTLVSQWTFRSGKKLCQAEGHYGSHVARLRSPLVCPHRGPDAVQILHPGGQDGNTGWKCFHFSFLFFFIDGEGWLGMDLAPRSYPFQSPSAAQVIGHHSSPPRNGLDTAGTVLRRKERVGSGGGCPPAPTPPETDRRDGRMSARGGACVAPLPPPPAPPALGDPAPRGSPTRGAGRPPQSLRLPEARGCLLGPRWGRPALRMSGSPASP